MGKKKKFALILRTPYQIAKESVVTFHILSPLTPLKMFPFWNLVWVIYSLSSILCHHLGECASSVSFFSACALTVYLKQVILNICDVIHYNKVYKVTTQKKIYFFVIWFPWGHPIVNLGHPFFPFYTCFLVIILHSWIMNVFGIYPYFTWIEMFPWWCYKNDTKMWFIWLHVLQGIVLLLCFGLFWIPLWVIITIYLWNKPSHTTKDWQN